MAQQIGKVGELAFASWAAKGLFTANKVDDDYGVDYMCQLLEPAGKSGSHEVTGKSVFVQVKTTTGTGSPRIGINREDAETALRQDGVFAMAVVNLPSEDVMARQGEFERDMVGDNAFAAKDPWFDSLDPPQVRLVYPGMYPIHRRNGLENCGAALSESLDSAPGSNRFSLAGLREHSAP